MDVNQHYAALLGLGDEWTVTNVVLDVPGKRVQKWGQTPKNGDRPHKNGDRPQMT